MKSHLETRSVARHVASPIGRHQCRGVQPPFLVMARFNSIGCGQGHANGRQQDQRCERDSTHIMETRKQALRSSISNRNRDQIGPLSSQK